MKDIIKLPAHKIVDLIKTKQVTSEEVTRAFLDRIRDINPSINAVVALNEEQALASAKKADLALR